MKAFFLAGLAAAVVAGGTASPATADPTDLLRASPKRVNFGTKAVGTFTVKGSTITNTGAADVLVQTSAVRMPDQFSWGLLPGQTCPIFSPEVLAAGASCDIVTGFRLRSGGRQPSRETFREPAVANVPERLGRCVRLRDERRLDQARGFVRP